MKNLAGKVAVVTGASSGIGRVIAVSLAESGCSLALIGRSQSRLKETAMLCEKSKAATLVRAFDIANTAEIPKAIAEITGTLGGLDILINSAGIGGKNSVAEADLTEWDQVIDVNLRALVHWTRLSLPHMTQAGWGAVINIASIAGKQSFGNSGIYCATKHGVVGLTGSLFEDVREKNIKVCAICPGFVDTPLVSGPKLDRGKMIAPEDIANTVQYVLSCPETVCPTEIILRPQHSPYS